MRSRRLVLVVLLCLSVSVFAAGAQFRETIPSGGHKRTIHIYRPDGVNPAAQGPLLVLLHGSGRDGPSILKEWKKLADAEKIVLAAPDALDSAAWTIPADGPEFLAEVVAAVVAKQPVDPKRVYLFGHSAGAIFSLRMAPMESELFAAAAAHAGAFFEPGEATILTFATRKIPVLLLVGDSDPQFPLEKVRGTRDMFVAAGFPAELIEIPHHDHNYYRRSSEINPKLWAFLSSKQLEKDGKAAAYTIQVGADGGVQISPK